jgi:hypothetical protein
MHCPQTDDPSVFALALFQECVVDSRQTLDHLAKIEATMANAVAEMKAQGQPRERLLVSESMLSDLRELLNMALPYRKPLPNESAHSERHLTVG